MFDLDIFKAGDMAVYCCGADEVNAFLDYLESNDISRDTYKHLQEHIKRYPHDTVGVRYVGYKSFYHLGWYSNEWRDRERIKGEVPFSAVGESDRLIKASFDEVSFMELITDV